VIGYNYRFFLQDRHGEGTFVPPIDPEQNVELLDAMELNGWTMFKFRRQLAACEPENDLSITVRLKSSI